METQFDAIVIGSGISGGWAAKELTEKGLKTLLLERGRNIEHVKDYLSAGKGSWEFPHRGEKTQQLSREYPVLDRDRLNEKNADWFSNELENPYTEVKPYSWKRAYQVGGRSLLWGRQSYRLSDIDFSANLMDGIAIDWPIRYREIAPWYDYVERFAGISGSREGLPQLPDGQFLKPMPLNCVEAEVAKRLQKAYKNQRHLIIGRTANLTEPIPGRGACQYQDNCWLGCVFGGYFSTQSSTLPAAVKTGNLTLRPWSIVTKILYDKDTRRATGVEVLDAETNLTYEYKAKIIFLNASTINSAWVLMNSATDIWPDGLGSSSGELGHNLMDHHFRCGANGIVEGFEDKWVYGRRPTGIYIPRFRNLNGEKRNYIRGFGYQGGANRQGWRRNANNLGIGVALKDALTEPGQWSMNLSAFGEILPYHNNRMYLDKDKKDKWGLPTVALDAEIGVNENTMRKEMIDDAKEMLEASGAKNVKTFDNGYYMGAAIHEMGSARMGNDTRTSVLNKFNQVWDAPNVFVTDGACMVSAACQNPSLTYMALTARAADYALYALKTKKI